MKKKTPIFKKRHIVTISLTDEEFGMLEFIMARRYSQNKSATIKALIRRDHAETLGKNETLGN